MIHSRRVWERSPAQPPSEAQIQLPVPEVTEKQSFPDSSGVDAPRTKEPQVTPQVLERHRTVRLTYVPSALRKLRL